MIADAAGERRIAQIAVGDHRVGVSDEIAEHARIGPQRTGAIILRVRRRRQHQAARHVVGIGGVSFGVMEGAAGAVVEDRRADLCEGRIRIEL
jgi:hypothetical protein